MSPALAIATIGGCEDLDGSFEVESCLGVRLSLS
jgi:hypothetical protein